MTAPTEQELASKATAPRVTQAEIDWNIVGEYYFTAAEGVMGRDLAAGDLHAPQVSIGQATSLGLLTFCVLVLRNGFTVTGESACASAENFDPEIGRRLARAHAVNKIWPLMGYELRSKLAAQA
jgi:hypothetical protein